MTTDKNDLGNKPHESPAGTKIFAFEIFYGDGDFSGRMTGRIEATDEQHALSLAYHEAPAAPTGGKVKLLKNQAAARKKPFVAMAHPKDGEFDVWFTANYPEARVNMQWEKLAQNLYVATQSAWHGRDAELEALKCRVAALTATLQQIDADLDLGNCNSCWKHSINIDAVLEKQP